MNLKICLLGDFNARSGKQQDIIFHDETMEQFLHSDNPNDELAKINIGDLGFPTERYNLDNKSNNYEKRLIEVCKSFNLCIANGRLGSDKFLGNRTCKGSSVVDYAILSPLLFTSVKEFEILHFEPLITPFIQIQQTRKGLPNADINKCIAEIHKVRKHKQTAFKLFLYKMRLCRVNAKWFILRMVQHYNKKKV